MVPQASSEAFARTRGVPLEHAATEVLDVLESLGLQPSRRCRGHAHSAARSHAWLGHYGRRIGCVQTACATVFCRCPRVGLSSRNPPRSPAGCVSASPPERTRVPMQYTDSEIRTLVTLSSIRAKSESMPRLQYSSTGAFGSLGKSFASPDEISDSGTLTAPLPCDRTACRYRLRMNTCTLTRVRAHGTPTACPGCWNMARKSRT
jgi:hypothetical protein